MFETEKFQAEIHKIGYAGKGDFAGEDNQESARVEVKFKVPMQDDIFFETERKYFSGIIDLADLTTEGKRQYDNKLKMNFPEQTLTIETRDGETVLLQHNSVDIRSPLQVVCEKGLPDMYIRVEFMWEASLNILKKLDGQLILLTIQTKQNEMFGELIDAARENDVVNSFSGWIAPKPDPEATKWPVDPHQVDYRYCHFKSPKKSKEMLKGMGPEVQHSIQQTAAMLAWKELAEPGKTVHITVEHIKQAARDFVDA